MRSKTWSNGELINLIETKKAVKVMTRYGFLIFEPKKEFLRVHERNGCLGIFDCSIENESKGSAVSIDCEKIAEFKEWIYWCVLDKHLTYESTVF